MTNHWWESRIFNPPSISPGLINPSRFSVMNSSIYYYKKNAYPSPAPIHKFCSFYGFRSFCEQNHNIIFNWIIIATLFVEKKIYKISENNIYFDNKNRNTKSIKTCLTLIVLIESLIPKEIYSFCTQVGMGK